jgi:hypothetical protein
MLKLNLSRLTREEIVEVVASYCAELGFVNSVAIPETTSRRTFALVTMASAGELEAVANMLGDCRMGEKVIIRLEQEEQFIPSSLLRGKRRLAGLE